MRRKDPPIIGFNRRVDLEWLGYTVRLFTGGHDESKIHEELSAYLSSKLSIGSSAKRGSREKTITLLLKTWVRVRPEIEPLRDDGLELLESLPKSQHLAVHWGMTMARLPILGRGCCGYWSSFAPAGNCRRYSDPTPRPRDLWRKGNGLSISAVCRQRVS